MDAEPWAGFLDAPVVTDHPYVGALRLPDTALPEAPQDAPLRAVVSGGAAQLSGPVELSRRRGLDLTAIETALRDLADPAGNARRVAAAADAAGLGGEEPPTLYVAVAGEPTASWLAALDEVAAAEHALTLDLDGPALESWIDAALDRELRFSLVGGSPSAAVEAVRITARLWGDPGDLAAGRRWCRSWACTDVGKAVTVLDEAQ
ncbi:hypothetical protein [Nocardioides sp. GXZ039]|uniref:hypothetical protein n=1 Tax=Nocardioides sp. GXZ039 TaxID=3136018 RepID=UPI0030F42139